MLPELAVHTPRSSCASSASLMALTAPRSLNAPLGWRFSSFRYTSFPRDSESSRFSRTSGARSVTSAIRSCAARTSSIGTRSRLRGRSHRQLASSVSVTPFEAYHSTTTGRHGSTLRPGPFHFPNRVPRHSGPRAGIHPLNHAISPPSAVLSNFGKVCAPPRRTCRPCRCMWIGGASGLTKGRMCFYS